MIRSEAGRGLIYAGDTPLALTIAVEQTWPMQLTVRAGSFTSTGQARIRPYDPPIHAALLASGKGELLADGKRIRGWIQDKTGVPRDIAKRYTLAAARTIALTSDPTRPVAYAVDLLGQGAAADVFGKRRIVGVDLFGSPPPGWKALHGLVYEFILPPGLTDVASVEVFVLTVTPGFPPGTGSDDWTTQTGGA